jgi:hypothetical protein
MAYPSVTYTFSNSTTADATQVNQNFTDLINGLSDGTKDLSISALTVAGTATLNGAINLGNATTDDITITGYLASSFIPKTNQTYDIGTADLGLRALYLGVASAGALTAKVIASASIAADRIFTVPEAGTDASFVMTAGTQTISGAKTFDTAGNAMKGITSGAAPGAGYIGEKISVTLTPSTLTGAYADVSSSLTLTKGVWMIYAAFTLSKTANSTAYCIFKLRDTTTPTDMYFYSWGTQGTATAMFSPHTIAVYVNQGITKSYVLQAYDPNNTSTVTFASNTGGIYGQQEFFAVRIA